MPAFHVVKFGGYPFDILLCVGASKEQIVEKLAELGVEMTVRERKNLGISETSAASTVVLKGGQFVISLRSYDGAAADLGVLCHEAFHAVWALMARIGVVASDDSEEALAYALQDVVAGLVGALTQARSLDVGE